MLIFQTKIEWIEKYIFLSSNNSTKLSNRNWNVLNERRDYCMHLRHWIPCPICKPKAKLTEMLQQNAWQLHDKNVSVELCCVMQTNDTIWNQNTKKLFYGTFLSKEEKKSQHFASLIIISFRYWLRLGEGK